MAKEEIAAIFGGQADKNEVLEHYAYKNGSAQQISHDSVPYMEPPFIDFSLLINSPSSDPKATEEFHKFKSALTSGGCFQLINHGLPSSSLFEMLELFKQFVALPLEEKQKYAMLPKNDTSNGYIGVKGDSTDQVLDWNEGLSLVVYPEDRRQLKFWPDKPLEFKEKLNEYTMKLTTIFEVLFRKMVHSLNVDEEKFFDRYGKNKQVNARFNFYPLCPRPDQVFGLKAHADFTPMTMILQDEVGLQVLKDGQWFMVPVVPDALFLIIGDPLEIMSNGIFKSVLHRVVANEEKARTSIAVFYDSDHGNEIGPLDELITSDSPQLYKRVSLKEYYTHFYDSYQSGKRPIELVKM